jgi:hypothetical protein
MNSVCNNKKPVSVIPSAGGDMGKEEDEEEGWNCAWSNRGVVGVE